jgi:hypothetical protein
VLRRLRLSWASAKALSVLQNAYEMPLKNPLNPLDETDLRRVTEIAFDTGGNAFDAAAAFMTYRIKAALQAELTLGGTVDDGAKDVGKLAVGIAATRNYMNFYRAHMTALSEINSLREAAEARRT